MVITSITSKLAITLALASRVIMPVAAFLSSELPYALSVTFFQEGRCNVNGPSISYSSSLSPDGCHTACQDLVDNNYTSISVLDSSPVNSTTCYLWKVPGCAGNYTQLARSGTTDNFPNPCTTADSSLGFIRSAWCYKGVCPG